VALRVGERRRPASRQRSTLAPGSSTRTEASASRLRGVEGLRALAASAIVVYHVWRYSSPTGQPFDLGILNRFVYPYLPSGVTLFFTLSGFLLYRPIVASVMRGGPLPNVRRYLRNRALRLVPAYWVVLFATAVVLPAVQVRVSHSDLELGRLVTHPAALIGNVFLVQNYFAGSIDTGIGPAWSLAVEVGFYLTLPLLGLVAATIAARRSNGARATIAVLAPPVLMLALGSVVALIASRLASGRTLDEVLVRSFLNNADLFAFGMAVAVLAAHVETGRLALPRWWAPAAGAALVVVVGATLVLVDRGALLVYQGAPAYESLTATASALLLCLVVLPARPGSPGPLAPILEARPLVTIGLASYSLFLWHEPIVRLCQHLGWTFGGRIGFLLNLFGLGGIALGLALLTYRFVERPALARKRPAAGSAQVADRSVPG
jgi:peptidoglycan/LPS O-acetylase OafA/YrhL